MISVPRGKDDLSLYRGIPSPLALAPWGFGQLLPAVSFSSCEFCNEQRNVLSVSLHPFIFRKRHWSTRYTQFAMILAGVLLGQIPCLYAPFGANTAPMHGNFDRITVHFLFAEKPCVSMVSGNRRHNRARPGVISGTGFFCLFGFLRSSPL